MMFERIDLIQSDRFANVEYSVKQISLCFLLMNSIACLDNKDVTASDTRTDTAEEQEDSIATSIVLSHRRATLISIGETKALTATVNDQEGNPIDETVSWTSADNTVVTVDSSGLLRAVENGTTIITASFNDLTAEIEVVVKQFASSIEL